MPAQATGEVRANLPLKWFSIPQCWRFETTQRGRKREHYQWNMDIVGEPGVAAEAELLAAVARFFSRIGVGPDVVGIRVNSRRVLDVAVAKAGVPKSKFARVCVIIDKLDKIGACAVKELLTDASGEDPLALPAETADVILACLAAGSVDEFAAAAGLPKTDPAIAELGQLFELAESYGVRDYLDFDASVVRGLAYYTGVVFEAFDKKGELRAIAGGGRYDRLLELYARPRPESFALSFERTRATVPPRRRRGRELRRYPAPLNIHVAAGPRRPASACANAAHTSRRGARDAGAGRASFPRAGTAARSARSRAAASGSATASWWSF